jgi:hypothetical protein
VLIDKFQRLAAHFAPARPREMLATSRTYPLRQQADLKEFLRRIAQHHHDAGIDGDVTPETAAAALHEMLFSGGTLNTKLLGGETVSPEPQ